MIKEQKPLMQSLQHSTMTQWFLIKPLIVSLMSELLTKKNSHLQKSSLIFYSKLFSCHWRCLKFAQLSHQL